MEIKNKKIPVFDGSADGYSVVLWANQEKTGYHVKGYLNSGLGTENEVRTKIMGDFYISDNGTCSVSLSTYNQNNPDNTRFNRLGRMMLSDGKFILYSENKTLPPIEVYPTDNMPNEMVELLGLRKAPKKSVQPRPPAQASGDSSVKPMSQTQESKAPQAESRSAMVNDQAAAPQAQDTPPAPPKAAPVRPTFGRPTFN